MNIVALTKSALSVSFVFYDIVALARGFNSPWVPPLRRFLVDKQLIINSIEVRSI
jgi:hypothetical protein